METYQGERKSKRRPGLFRSLGKQLLIYALLLFSIPSFLSAAVFHVASGDVPGLIAAINSANANGEENTIILAPGTYTLTAADNTTGPPPGANGLPVFTSALTLRGEGAHVTSIARNDSAPPFRILLVAATGTLTFNGLTISGGNAGLGAGGGIANEGNVIITGSAITHNRTGQIGERGGGVFNTGTMTISRSTIASNVSGSDGGGIWNLGTMTIRESTIADNHAIDAEAGGISNDGALFITNSTIADNDGDGVGGIRNSGTLTLTNSTLSRNHAFFGDFRISGGIQVGAGTVTLQDTILALNTVGRMFPPVTTVDCFGSIISLGSNLIGVNCGIALQPSDLTGDPGLGDFIDDGAPGEGRFPLLPGSRAIDAGNDAACSPTDQLGTPRNGPCDIGAVEFYPVVNDLVALGNLSTAFDPLSVSGGPAGTFRITADFTNTSNQPIVNPFAEVVNLTGENLLLNADGGAGGVGARLTLPSSTTTPLEPGVSSTFEFLIGLKLGEAFTFFVNMLGEPRTSSPYVATR